MSDSLGLSGLRTELEKEGRFSGSQDGRSWGRRDSKGGDNSPGDECCEENRTGRAGMTREVPSEGTGGFSAVALELGPREKEEPAVVLGNRGL